MSLYGQGLLQTARESLRQKQSGTRAALLTRMYSDRRLCIKQGVNANLHLISNSNSNDNNNKYDQYLVLGVGHERLDHLLKTLLGSTDDSNNNNNNNILGKCIRIFLVDFPCIIEGHLSSERKLDISNYDISSIVVELELIPLPVDISDIDGLEYALVQNCFDFKASSLILIEMVLNYVYVSSVHNVEKMLTNKFKSDDTPLLSEHIC